MVDETTPFDLLEMTDAELRLHFADADTEEIEAAMIAVQNYVDGLNQARLLLNAIFEEKTAQSQAAARYANLSEPEKVALAQFLAVDGIDGSTQLGAI